MFSNICYSQIDLDDILSPPPRSKNDPKTVDDHKKAIEETGLNLKKFPIKGIEFRWADSQYWVKEFKTEDTTITENNLFFLGGIPPVPDSLKGVVNVIKIPISEEFDLKTSEKLIFNSLTEGFKGGEFSVTSNIEGIHENRFTFSVNNLKKNQLEYTSIIGQVIQNESNLLLLIYNTNDPEVTNEISTVWKNRFENNSVLNKEKK
ncbi:MAG: hypothetical protein ACRCVT_11395 [Leadbetterella sp.]